MAATDYAFHADPVLRPMESEVQRRARLDEGRDLSDPRWEENTKAKAIAAAMAQIERAFPTKAQAMERAA